MSGAGGGVAVSGAPGQAWDAGYLNPSDIPFGSDFYDLWYFDGTTSTKLGSAINGFSVGDDGNLYTFKDFTIHRIAPTTHASTVAALVGQVAAETNTALAILPGSTQAVVGTSDSRLKLVDLT